MRKTELERSTPTVAVVIPTYNRARWVRQTIESVLGQTRPPDEVIVVDDGSRDDTRTAVCAFGNAVRYLRKENGGKASALNHALPEVGSDYVWLMDDDDIAMPDALEAHLAFLGAHADLDFSYGAHYEFRGDEPPTVEFLSAHVPMPIRAVAPEELFVHAMLWFPFYSQSMLVPRRCYEAVGPFDESLGFTDDYDMILRLARRFRGGSVSAPIFCLRVGSGLRGPSHAPGTADERYAMFRDSDRRTFARLYATLPLSEYLPRGAATGPLNDLDARRARLQRACIMTRHGLFEEGFADLRSVLDYSKNGATLSSAERKILTQMLGAEAWWLKAYPDYTASLGRLLRRRHAYSALEACAKGLGWRLESSVRCRRYGDAMRIGAHLQRLVGVTRLPALVAAKFKRRGRECRAAA